MRLLALFLFALFIPSAQPAALPACSVAVHDSYKTTGPDGMLYATWHPQVDLEYGCINDHEHGSNPALFLPGYKPLFGYSAKGSEVHAGFKVVVFDDRNSHRWLVLMHQGTANAQAAACARFHTLDFAAVDTRTHELLADLHFMGDFGIARAATEAREPLTPPACPNQAQEATADGSKGVRQFPVVDHGNVSYEPWRVYMPPSNNVLGFSGADFVMNTLNPRTACDTLSCTNVIQRGAGNVGNYRTISWRAGLLGFPAATAMRGEAYTDVRATQVLSSTDPLAVRQYLCPGLAVQTRADISDAQPHAGDMLFVAGEFVNRGREQPFRNNPWLTGAN